MSTTPDRPSDLSRIFDEFLDRRQLGESPVLDEYCQRFPDLAEQLRLHLRLYDALADAGSETDDPVASAQVPAKSATPRIPSEEQPRRSGSPQVFALFKELLDS